MSLLHMKIIKKKENKRENRLMKNIEKYYDVIKQKLQKTDVLNLYCTVNEIRTGCDDCPEWRDCRECCLKNIEWLNQEFKEPILDDVEKEYLSAVIKPFRKNIEYIRKTKSQYTTVKQFISIVFYNDDYMNFPYLDDDEMYKGMEVNREYSLEELGL